MKRSKIGILPGGRQPLADLERVAKAADAGGFASIWASDGIGDIFSTLTAYAVHTSGIRLGAGVAVWHRPPVITAIASAQLSELSGNRFVLGLGSGPKQWNENYWGIPFERPISRMREYIEVVRGAAMSRPGAPFTYTGERFTVTGYVRSGGKPLESSPPVWLGTVGPQMNGLAGQIADGVLFDLYLSPRYLRDVALPRIESGLRSSGRSRSAFTTAALLPCVVAPDLTTGLRGLKQSILGQLSNEYFYPIWRDDGVEQEALAARDKLASGDFEGAIAAISDEFAATIGIAGTPDDCRRQAQRFLDISDEIVLLPPSFRFSDGEFAAMRDAILDTFAV